VLSAPPANAGNRERGARLERDVRKLHAQRRLPLARLAAVVVAALMAACAGLGTPPPSVPAQSAPSSAGAPAAVAGAPTPIAASKPEPAPGAATADSTAPSPSVAAAAPQAKPAAPVPPSAKATTTPATAAAAQAARKEITPAQVAKPKSPPLDLASLKQQLKDTKAIGVLTKITLKNQVDDLLDQFRAFYQGTLKITVAELRRSYDLLVLKVLALLQDSDQSLATAIAASREAIWGILADPVKFAAI
jgi:hypothetical protein